MYKIRSLFLPICLLLALTVSAQDRHLPADTIVKSKNSIRIGGKNVPYQTHCGTLPLWNDEGQAIATIFYTYYYREDVENRAERPLLFSFNGGPGSASAWMHLGYTGPALLNLDSEGYPVQPYGVKDNPHSVLDVADIVYVNPVNTGYSRMLPDEEGEYPDRKKFFGVNADIKYLADWIRSFISRNNRWQSPKFLIGESYGGTRVSGLALELQNQQWMYLNGVILVSPADYKVYRGNTPIKLAVKLPYYTATAWHHKALDASLQEKDLEEILPEVEDFAIETYIPAIAKGSQLSEEEKEEVAEQMSLYSGLSVESILSHDLRVSPSFFWKELQREEGFTLGRLDSRYLGIDRKEAGNRPDYNPELTSWLHSFTPAINYYLREELQFHTDLPYKMFGDVHPWDFEGDNTRENLRKALAENPYLNVLYQAGYYDGATTYFNSKYSMWQLDPAGVLSDRLHFKTYRSGHMMYVRDEDLKSASHDLREFIRDYATPGKAAKY